MDCDPICQTTFKGGQGHKGTLLYTSGKATLSLIHIRQVGGQKKAIWL